MRAHLIVVAVLAVGALGDSINERDFDDTKPKPVIHHPKPHGHGFPVPQPNVIYHPDPEQIDVKPAKSLRALLLFTQALANDANLPKFTKEQDAEIRKKLTKSERELRKVLLDVLNSKKVHKLHKIADDITKDEFKNGKYSASYDVSQRLGQHAGWLLTTFKKAFHQAADLGRAYAHHTEQALEDGEHFAKSLENITHFLQSPRVADSVGPIFTHGFEVRLALQSLINFLRKPHPFNFAYFEKNLTVDALADFYLSNYTEYHAQFFRAHDEQYERRGGIKPAKEAILLAIWQQVEMLVEYRALAPLPYAFYLGYTDRFTEYFVNEAQDRFFETYTIDTTIFMVTSLLAELREHKPHGHKSESSERSDESE